MDNGSPIPHLQSMLLVPMGKIVDFEEEL